MPKTKKFIIDFDSTFTRVEALDILGEISLSGDPRQQEKLQAIKDITDKGMDGSLTFRESLEQRLDILQASKSQIAELIVVLKQKVSKSFERNKDWLKDNAADVFIISNGFKDFIIPIVTEYGIKEENVFANDLIYDESGKIINFNRENPFPKIMASRKPSVISTWMETFMSLEMATPTTKLRHLDWPINFMPLQKM